MQAVPITSRRFLAMTYLDAGQYSEAERFLSKALNGRELKLNPDHPAGFESMHELAVCCKETGDYIKAEQRLVKVVRGRRLKLGDTHPHAKESVMILIDLHGAWNKPGKTEAGQAKLT